MIAYRMVHRQCKQILALKKLPLEKTNTFIMKFISQG